MQTKVPRFIQPRLVYLALLSNTQKKKRMLRSGVTFGGAKKMPPKGGIKTPDPGGAEPAQGYDVVAFTSYCYKEYPTL